MTRRERLEAKLEKRREWAGKAASRSAARFDAAHRLADQIPLGQPILIGHHSEGRARRDAQRIQGNMSRGVEESRLAEHHEGKAAGLAAQLDRTVFADDPDAIEQIEARIAAAEAKRERMKTINRLYKKGDAPGLAALGLDLETLRARVAGVGLSWVKAPYEGYELTNLGARIRADQERIKAIRARQARSARADAAGGVVIEGTDYVRVTFAEKPDRTILDALRAAGFQWGAGSWVGRRDRLPESVVTMAGDAGDGGAA